MFSFLDNVRGIEFSAVAIKLVLSCLCGLVIGLERSSKNRPAGFRTHILVCMGGAAAALTGLYIYLGLQLPADISRIGSQVISGLGFIGAGAIIITKKQTIKGLTTAAGLWTTGIIGLAIGNGYYELGLLGTALLLLAESFFFSIGRKIQSPPQYGLLLTYNEKDSLDHVLRHCKDSHMSIVNLRIRSLDNDEDASYIADVVLRGNVRSEAMVEQLRRMPGIVSAEEADA